MSRSECGRRPLLIDMIKRHILYIQDIQTRKKSLVTKAWEFELSNTISPNFTTYINKFNLNLNDISNLRKHKINETLYNIYDRFWKIELDKSPNATSFKHYKNSINFESYLSQTKSVKYRIGISRFRLSNHNLMIEKGRHLKPKLERNARKCYMCKDKIEDEEHFLITCPLFSPQRKTLDNICKENCERYTNFTTNQKFVFIMSNENVNIIKALGQFVSNSLNLREQIIDYFFL